jgi:hypothetical protein
MPEENGWWFDGEPCEQDELSYCARCKPHHYPMIVYMTRGWSSAFHKSPTCDALQSGQEQVVRRGGDAAEIEPVNIQTALGSGRFPCLICLPSEVQ